MKTFSKAGIKSTLAIIKDREKIKLDLNGDPISGGTVARRKFYKDLKTTGEQDFDADLNLGSLYVDRVFRDDENNMPDSP